jgi:hypothetical protein
MVYFPESFHATSDTDWNWVYELHQFPEPAGAANLALSVVMNAADLPAGHEHARNQARPSTRILGGGSPQHPIDLTDASSGPLYTSATCMNNPDVRRHWIVGPRLRRERWYDFVWHVPWDWRSNTAGGQGLVERFLDGHELGSYRGSTLFFYANNGTGAAGPGQAYLQHGYYRPTDSVAGYAQPTISVYHAATMIGPSAAAVGLSLPAAD